MVERTPILLLLLLFITTALATADGAVPSNVVEVLRRGSEDPHNELGPLWEVARECGALYTGSALAAAAAAAQTQTARECTPETLFWLYHNLALEARRQHARKEARQDADRRREYDLCVQFFAKTAAVAVPAELPGPVREWARFLRAAGETESALQVLKRGIVTMGSDVRAELFLEVGSLFHDNRQWNEAAYAFAQAVGLIGARDSDDVKRQVLMYHTYMRCFLGEWDGYNMLLARIADSAESTAREVARGGEEGLHEALTGNTIDGFLLAVHPWMTLNYVMPPELRLTIARDFSKMQTLHAKHRLNEISGKVLGRRRFDPAVALRRPRDQRLRVGFVSADFKDKATSYLCHGLFEHFDRSTTEVFVYATSPDDVYGSPWRAAERDGAEHFRDVSAGGPVAAANRILADRIDILVDMDGYANEGLRMGELFAVRLAPVTVAFFVYIGTTGNEHMDYIVTDHVATPPHLAHHFSENFLFLPASFFPNSHARQYPGPNFGKIAKVRRANKDKIAVQAGDWIHYHTTREDEDMSAASVFGSRSGGHGAQAVPSRAEVGLPTDGAPFVFCSFNKVVKMRPDLFATWMRVLKRVPNSVLWLLHNPLEAEERLRRAVARHGIEQDRVVFARFIDSAEANFARLAVGADLVLDTTVYGAHTGSVDALWAGVPLLTCVGDGCLPDDIPDGHGDQMASRIAASLLHAARLADPLVTASLREYEDAAVAIATEPSLHRDLVARVAAARRLPLFDTAQHARNLQRGLHAAWKQYLTGEARADVDVSHAPPPAATGEEL